MTEQLVCFDCKKEVPEYDARREVYDEKERERIWQDVKVCKKCKVLEKLQNLRNEYSYYYNYNTIKVNDTIYSFNLKKARLIFIEYDGIDDTFLVHIVYTSIHNYIIVYDFDLNPLRVV